MSSEGNSCDRSFESPPGGGLEWEGGSGSDPLMRSSPGDDKCSTGGGCQTWGGDGRRIRPGSGVPRNAGGGEALSAGRAPPRTAEGVCNVRDQPKEDDNARSLNMMGLRKVRGWWTQRFTKSDSCRLGCECRRHEITRHTCTKRQQNTAWSKRENELPCHPTNARISLDLIANEKWWNLFVKRMCIT